VQGVTQSNYRFIKDKIGKIPNSESKIQNSRKYQSDKVTKFQMVENAKMPKYQNTK